MPGRHTFASRAQMRWAYATRQPFAKRWGEATELAGKSKTLPARTGRRTARSLMTRKHSR
jgi:hypothetical protein